MTDPNIRVRIYRGISDEVVFEQDVLADNTATVWITLPGLPAGDYRIETTEIPWSEMYPDTLSDESETER